MKILEERTFIYLSTIIILLYYLIPYFVLKNVSNSSAPFFWLSLSVLWIIASLIYLWKR